MKCLEPVSDPLPTYNNIGYLEGLSEKNIFLMYCYLLLHSES